jgi:hypothetical protein
MAASGEELMVQQFSGVDERLIDKITNGAVVVEVVAVVVTTIYGSERSRASGLDVSKSS